MTATLDKKPVTLRRFRTRSVFDKSRRGQNRKAITIPIPLKNGEKFIIKFTTVPQKGSLAPDYCFCDINEEGIIPKTAKSKELQGKKVIDFIKESEEFRQGTIYEDLIWFHEELAKKEAETQKKLEEKEAQLKGFDTGKQTNKENE